MMETFNTVIESGASFVCYRFPNENQLHYIFSEETPLQLFDYSDLNNYSGFVIAPFAIDKETPILLFHGTPKVIMLPKNKEVPSTFIFEKEAEISVVYKKGFERFKKELDDRFTKLVLSRVHQQKYEGTIDICSSFYKALSTYPDAFVYMYFTPQTGVWLGASPELLLKVDKKNGTTVALAGTQSLANGQLPMQWSDKNKQEQDYVVQYIRNILSDKSLSFYEEGPKTIQAGKLVHLKTIFRFDVLPNFHVGDLIKDLHPTPAVCGIPKNEAYQLIQQVEHHKRKYYSGFLGILNEQKMTKLFVNLRCVQIADKNKKIDFYAGGGILKHSILEDEWNETCRKMYTMSDIIVK